MSVRTLFYNMVQKIPSVRFRAELIVDIVLVLAVLAVIADLPAKLPLQAAGWLTFLAILAIPGYFVTRMATHRLEIDQLERLALAFPVGIAVFAVPGLMALMLHFTIQQLFTGWLASTGLVLAAYFYFFYLRKTGVQALKPVVRWTWDEIILFALLIATFIYILPALTAPRIDGDLYTFMTKVSDTLIGTPMNVTEPIFGTDLKPGVRSEFNQFSTIWSLWAYLAKESPVDLTSNTSRALLAMFAMLATYSLGKAAGGGSRRVGLFTAALQLLIYMVDPFFRGDSPSLFFFERTNADKFTVSVTMMPLVFSQCIYFIRKGERRAWWMAVIVAFTVSTIHPLIAALQALGLAAFGGLHLLLNLRSRVSWMRVVNLAVVAAVTMFLPMILLVMSRSSTPLAPTYPQSFEGWSLGVEMAPVLPFYKMPNLDWYGPAPDLANMEASEANTNTSPFLVWRYTANMRRQRLIITDVNKYIADPGIMMEPPFILAFLLCPFLLWGLRKRIGAQFALATTLAVPFVLYNPILTPKVGALVVPWLMWRFAWLLPYALVLALAINRCVSFISSRMSRSVRAGSLGQRFRSTAPLALILIAGALLSPVMRVNVQAFTLQSTVVSTFPVPEEVLARLHEETLRTGPVMVAADNSLSVTIPVFAPNANIIAHRIFNTSEFFPADQQDVALQRLIDQNDLFTSLYLTEEAIEVLRKYDIRFILVSSTSNLNFQLHLSPQWFEWLVDGETYSLYAVRELPTMTESVRGNTALAEYRWEAAQQHFDAALARDEGDLLALAGMANVELAKGRFEEAIEKLQQIASLSHTPNADYRLGFLFKNAGQQELSLESFWRATQASPTISRYHLALGDACLEVGLLDCAGQEYEAAASSVKDEASRLMAIANYWRQRGKNDQALPLYKAAVQINPSQDNLLQLSRVYGDLGQYEQAEALLLDLQEKDPLSEEILFRMAQLKLTQDEPDQAIDLYRRAIWLQELKIKDSTQVRLALAQTLLDNNRLEEAKEEIDQVLSSQPNNATAYIQLGRLYAQQNEPELVVSAYQKALELDPSDISAYASLQTEYQQRAELDENLDLLRSGTENNPRSTSLLFSLARQLQQLGSLDTAITAYQLVLDVLESLETQPSSQVNANERLKSQTYRNLAAIYEDLGQVQVSMGYMRAAAAASPTNQMIQSLLADSLRRRNDTLAAEEIYRKLIEDDPTYIPAYLSLADLLRSRGDLTGAEEVFQQAVQVYFEEPEQLAGVVTSLGREILSRQLSYIAANLGSAEEEGDAPLTEGYQDELDAFVQSLESSDGMTPLQALSVIYQQTNQTDLAIELFRAAVESSEEEGFTAAEISRLYSQLGGLYFSQGQYQQAESAYQSSLELNPWSSAARIGLSRVHFAEGDVSRGLEQLETAAGNSPGDTGAQLSLARALDQYGDRVRALELLQTLAESRPGNSQINLAYAQALSARSRWAEAEEVYTRVINNTPNSVDAYTGLANLYIEQARFIDASWILRQAGQVDYADTQTHLLSGSMMARLSNHTEALQAYRDALQLEAGNMQALMGMANAYQALGQVEEAIQALDRAATANPTATQPLLALASIYREQNQPGQAEDSLLQALERSPADIAVRNALAGLYRSLARSDKALEQLRLAKEEHPEMVTALLGYANELRRQGKTEEAEALYQQVEQKQGLTAAEYRALASAREEQGDLEGALELVEQSMSAFPDDAANWLQKAGLQTQLGQREAALGSLQQAVQLSPNDGRAWQSLGSALLEAGRQQEAIEALKRSIAVSPTNLATYNALMNAYRSSGQAHQVPGIVSQAREAVPGSYLVDLYEGRYLLAETDWEQAEEAYRRSIEKAPGVVEPYLALGDLLVSRVRSREALAVYRKALSVEAENMQALMGMADAYQALGQVEEAIRALDRAAAANPTATQPLLALATIYREQNQPGQAEDSLLQALERSPADVSVRNALAGLYRSLARSDKALEQLQLAKEEHPELVTALLGYANELRRQGKTGEAEEIYQQVEQKQGLTAAEYRALSSAREEQGDLQGALELVERSMEAFPDDATNWLQKAGLQAQLGQDEAALASYQQAVQLAPDDGRAWQALGTALLDAGRQQEAIEALERSIELRPTFPQAYNALIGAYPFAGQAEIVKEIFTRARLAVPNSYQIDLFEGRYLLEQEDFDGAEAAYRQALAKAPGLVEPYIALGGYLSRNSRFAEAMELFKQALQIDPRNERIYNQLELTYERAAIAEELYPIKNKAAYVNALLTNGHGVGHELDSSPLPVNPP